MKKKLVALLLVSAMTAAMVVGCGSGEEKKTEETKTEETAEKKELADDEYQYVSAEDTVKAKDVHILDVREWQKLTIMPQVSSSYYFVLLIKYEFIKSRTLFN